MNKIKEYFDTQTFIITITFCMTWIISTDYIVDHFTPEHLHTQLQTIKGIIFVTFISIALAILHGREKFILKERRDEFIMLFENSPTPTLIFDFSTYKVVEVNQMALALFKYPRNEIEKKTMYELFNNADQWQPILENLKDNPTTKSHIESKAIDRLKNDVPLSLNFGGFNIFSKNYILVHLNTKKREA